ncbi:MAG: right-handed parallel beta-helix repeat-containing protein [Bacteroidetes bacterium]|nr:right-handed parallel beta-helix repeat-containing protein [Bacteroidota bacterium]
MKLLRLSLILFFLLNLSQIFAQWQKISSGTTANLVDGCFVSDSIGFVISSGGKVYKTSDQGTTWHLTGSLSGVFKAICSSGPDTVYAGGNCIFRSTDRGVTWNLIKSFTYTITDLIFFRGGAGFMVIPGYTVCNWSGGTTYIPNYIVNKSVDGGITWTYAFSPNDPGGSFDVVNDHMATITGGHHELVAHCSGPWYNDSRRTVNMGASWTYLGLPTGPYGGYLISYVNDSVGYYVREQQKIYKTTQGNNGIKGYDAEVPGSVHQNKFINEIDGYLVSLHNIYLTRSDGLAWTSDYFAADTINYLFRGKQNFLYAVGTNGLILRKYHVESTSPEPVYRLRSSKNPVYFGNLSINGLSAIPITLTNTGNRLLELTLKVSDPYGISFTNDSYGVSLHVSLAQQSDTVVFVRFNPTHQGNYPDTLRISSPELSPMKIPLVGFSFPPLVNNILSDTVICSDTLLIGANIIVMDSAKLTICAGTHVIILGVYNLRIRGILEAFGDSLNPIRIESLDPAVPWTGILFEHSVATDTSFLRYCTLTSNCYKSPILLNNGVVRIDYCSISNLYDYVTPPGGIALSGNATQRPILIITNSKIFNINGEAIHCNKFNPSVIENNEIFNNHYGVWASGNSGLLITKNHIHHNRYEGISGSGVVEILDNKIHNNGGGINWTSYGSVIENNVIYNNASDLIGGMCLTVKDGEKKIAQNLIYNNSNRTYGAGMILKLDYSDSLPPMVINNTICNNKVVGGGQGNEFYAWIVGGTAKKFRMYNNIIYNLSDSNNISWYRGVSGELECNSIRQKNADTLGQNTIIADPALNLPTVSSGFMQNLGIYSWELLSNSPCINAGNMDLISNLSDVDFAGNPRITQSRVDVGAYEYPFPYHVYEKQTDAPFSVYPNPADDILHVMVNKNQVAGIVIYDLTSRMVMQADFTGHISLNTRFLASGIYLYQLRVNDGTNIGGKFVKK